jgi:DNA-binding transcriptional MerR regulator/methylmalonyl-CoA mutase cobalamin-binding subunit
MYSIKAVSQATGLTVETLRAWERRYSIVTPKRDATGRRVYGPEDVLRLRLLREATDRGHPIRRLASLGDEELTGLVGEASTPRPAAGPGGIAGRMLEAARNFRSAECEQALTLAIALLPPQQLFTEVLQPLLREVGERWHRGEFAISQERLISSTVRRHLGLVLDSYDRIARRQDIVFATLPGERHELGLLMAAIVCSSRGFKAHYLGPDLPPAEIAKYAQEMGASIVALSVMLQEHLTDVPQQLRTLVEELGPGSKVWVGGAAAQLLDKGALPQGCICVRDQAELDRRLDMLAA